MSDPIYRLGLMGLIYSNLDSNAVDAGQSPQLLEYLKGQGIPVTEPELRQRIQMCLEVVLHELEYYDASELKVNVLLERYIVELLEGMANGSRVSGRDISMMICSLGNKNNDHDSEGAVQALLNRAHSSLTMFHDVSDLKGKPAEVINAASSQLSYIVKILSLLDIFVTSRMGMLAGLEEYAPVDYNYLNPVEETDWSVTGAECSTQDDCRCGCVLEAPLKLLQGMEDFLDGVESDDRLYFEGVANANNIRLQQYAGNEGPVYEAIKDLARKSYEAVLAAWKNIKEWFDSDESEKDKKTESDAEDNKKAIQGMDNNAKINDAAKKGIEALAEKTDPTGAMGKIVLKLTGPSAAGGVIDGLLGLLTKHSSTGAELQTQKKDAEAALDELKKASDGVNGNDENAEAASAAKTTVKEKVKTAKDAVSKAKKTVQEHNKITAGIRKAIAGITPHIFVLEGAPAKDDDEDGEKPQKGKGKKK